MKKPSTVTIGGNTYSVHFQHSTTCVLVPQSVGANLDPLTGRTNCGARDDFDKTTGKLKKRRGGQSQRRPNVIPVAHQLDLRS